MKTVLVLSLFLLSANALTERCAEVKLQFNRCTKTAHQVYLDAMTKGDDGRPYYRARTVCNYLMDAIEDCGNGTMEDGCTTEEAVTEMKDTQLSKVLENIGQSIADFDSCKCPPVKAHLNRMKAAEGAKFVQECYDDYGMAAGATNCFISVLFVPLLVLRYMY